jgi:hypothetical protein
VQPYALIFFGFSFFYVFFWSFLISFLFGFYSSLIILLICSYSSRMSYSSSSYSSLLIFTLFVVWSESWLFRINLILDPDPIFFDADLLQLKKCGQHPMKKRSFLYSCEDCSYKSSFPRYLFTGTSVPDPDPQVFGPPGSGSTSQRHRWGSGSSCKNSKKTLIPSILWLFLTFVTFWL